MSVAMVQEPDDKRKTVCVFKQKGQTPLDAIREFRDRNPKYRSETIGYAGRLDPMAEGALLLLIGDENRNRRTYERLPKEYEFSILFGVATDSFDLLGVITRVQTRIRSDALKITLTSLMPRLAGKQRQDYPPYSAARVDGKPLYYWARRSELTGKRIPSHEIEIFRLELTGVTMLSISRSEILERIASVRGDFRQEAITESWNRFFRMNPKPDLPIASLVMTCSGGTYVRQLVHDTAERIGVPAVTFRIRRTKVGEFGWIS
jgi:tRNA pseudouridine55 synthase